MKEAFMREAFRLAREHMEAGEGGPFGAVVVRGGRVVARGWNRVTSAFDPTAHAEVEAIRAAGRELRDYSLRGCELYASCEPCPMCLAACHWARLDRVYYAASRGDAAAAGFDDEFLYRALSEAGVGGAAGAVGGLLPREVMLAEEGRAVLGLWRAKADRVPY